MASQPATAQSLSLVPIALQERSPEAAAATVERLLELTLAGRSQGTRRNYTHYIRLFLAAQLPLNRDGVVLYMDGLKATGLASATRSGALVAVKQFAKEAELRGLIPYLQYAAIKEIRGHKVYRSKKGLWLTTAQVKDLLALPDRSTYFGKRDAAILGILVGCGLRRDELANLTWDHYQSREGRMCLVDVLGKGGKRRTVPVPHWIREDVDVWKEASKEMPPIPKRTPENYVEAFQMVWRRQNHDTSLLAGGIKPNAIMLLVRRYGKRLGTPLNPHDLRRTLAQMMRKAGAPLEQIQHTLGHESLVVTQVYLGSQLNLEPGKAAVDLIPL
jgi:integrase